MTHFEILEKLHPDIIAHFLETGESQAIPKDTQEWLQQITMAYEEYELNRNISQAAKQLQIKILAKFHKRLEIRTCQNRIYSALIYFHVDSTVPDKIWNIDFANKYEDLSTIAIEEKDLKTAKACYDAARECRERASEAMELESEFAPIFLISNDIDILDAGFKKKSLKEIARKHNEGYYLNLIESLPIDKNEKERLLIDADYTKDEQIQIETD